ncbi:MAG TPA: hypothetical protein ACFE0H_13845 [Elainellaceae cyanobacterium]
MAKSSSKPAPESMETKLLEIESDLAAQEAQIAAQLQTLQDKRKSLQTVIHMFGAEPDAMLDASVAGDDALATDVSDVSDHSRSAVTSDVAEVSPEPTSSPRGRQKKEASPTKSRTASKSSSKSSTKRAGKKSDEWGAYLKPKYRDRPLLQAVLSVLEQYPDQVVEVPYIMDSILVDRTPKEIRALVRHRLSNVLTVGLKRQKWYRGKVGTYSVSKEAARASRV